MTGSVIIEPEGAGFRVRLDPPDPAHPDLWFAEARKARGAAGGVRLVTGRQKIDRCGDG